MGNGVSRMQDLPLIRLRAGRKWRVPATPFKILNPARFPKIIGHQILNVELPNA